MKLILHTVFKDLRALRWLLLGWAAFLVLAGVLGLSIDSNGSGGRLTIFQMVKSVLANGAMSGSLALAFGLMCRLVMLDSPTDERAFWLTRPLSGTQLVLSKFLCFALLSLIPVVVSIPWWLYCSPGIPCLLTTSFWVWSRHLALGLIALPVALLLKHGREQIDHFLLWVLLVVTVVVAAFVWLSSRGFYHALPNSLRDTRISVAALAALLCFVAMAFSLYKGRRLLVGALIGGGGLVSALLVLCLWPWDCLLALHRAPLAGPELSGKMLGFKPNYEGYFGLARVSLRLKLPKGAQDIGGSVIEGTWREGNLHVPVKGMLQRLGRGDLARRDALAARAASAMPLGSDEFVDATLLLNGSDQTETQALLSARIENKGTDAEAHLRLLLSSFSQRILCQVPFESGAFARAPAYVMQVGEIRFQGDSLFVEIKDRGMTSLPQYCFLVFPGNGRNECIRLRRMLSREGYVLDVRVRQSYYRVDRESLRLLGLSDDLKASTEALRKIKLVAVVSVPIGDYEIELRGTVPALTQDTRP
jgi:hypothetical protein